MKTLFKQQARQPRNTKPQNQHLRELPSFTFDISEHPLTAEFRLFVTKRVLPLVQVAGYKQDVKRELLTWMVHHLVATQIRGACVADSADWHQSGARMRAELWTSLVAAKLAIKRTGSEASRMVTRYGATNELLRLRREWELGFMEDLDLPRNTERDTATAHGLVYLHTGKIDLTTGEPLPADQQKTGINFKHLCTENGLAMLRSIEDIVEAFNHNNLMHGWMYRPAVVDPGQSPSSPLNPCLRQIHCGEFYRAVRFYSWGTWSGQSLSKAERKTILIDGEPAAELDYSASLLRMLYHLKGLDPQGDLYRPELILPRASKQADSVQQETLRGFIKKATLRCLNVKSRMKAHSSIGKLLREHPEPEYLKAALKLDNAGPIELVSQIVGAHRELIAAWRSESDDCGPFFNETGLQMMTEESKVMKKMLVEFTKARVPALMIHDAVVSKQSDVKFAKKTMTKAYQYILATEFSPVIKREF